MAQRDGPGVLYVILLGLPKLPKVIHLATKRSYGASGLPVNLSRLNFPLLEVGLYFLTTKGALSIN